MTVNQDMAWTGVKQQAPGPGLGLSDVPSQKVASPVWKGEEGYGGQSFGGLPHLSTDVDCSFYTPSHWCICTPPAVYTPSGSEA